ncbi:MAG: hypothetical protein H6518_13065 [Microthrixaceae bacterium]|nr:hypothetical protein [Microthrixaceae bacterium]
MPGAPEVPASLAADSVWTDAAVAAAGLPVVDAPLVSIGGGLGSLALVDVLRLSGVPCEDVAVVTTLAEPADTYRYLARNSQIDADDRLRSDAGSVMDNIWGFPSYAWREAWDDRSLSPLLTVATEPLIAEYFTPRAGQVYRSVSREVARIGWDRMVHGGLGRVVRRRDEEGYFVLVAPVRGERRGPAADRVRALRCRHVHLAVGYPGIRLLDDLRAFRAAHPDHGHRILNAYEPHEHAYAEARRRPTTVVVRGSGIVASRVIERLLSDITEHGADTRVLHLFRHYVDGPQGRAPWFRRPGRDGYAYQAFNFPKAAWGGQVRDRVEAASGEERAALVRRLGGTNTAPRRTWQRQQRRMARAGRYVALTGVVRDVRPGADGRSIVTTLGPTSGDGAGQAVAADLVIDATGLQAELTDHALLADLLAHGGATRNPSGRLEVTPQFEVVGARSRAGRVYATGSITLGGPYAGVDSFLGLQYGALRIADELAAAGFASRLGPLRSTRQWWRWARNRTPEGARP